MTHLMTLLAALGCGLIAGVFFGFSSFVMPALARLRWDRGVRAMQAINVVVLNPGFLGVLLGTALICGGLALSALAAWSEPEAYLRFAGACSYLVGTIWVTIRYHVPRNGTLSNLAADSAEAERFWPEYVAGWSAWNHVRGASAFVAAALLTLALFAVSGCSRLVPIAPPDRRHPSSDCPRSVSSRAIRRVKCRVLASWLTTSMRRSTPMARASDASCM